MADKQYKALQPVGRFNKDGFVVGLSEKQIADLLEAKVIVEVAEETQAETETPLVEVKAPVKQKEVKADVK
ncbi:hypothetical protein [Acinetobacter sp. ANC5681]|uniref:hypothetical protein n=1 Tax=Acinetobacter sp. ANC5681 TaxID=2929504 RepID=UPI00201B0BF8|nr:hypothetical protein [Acinetobacter sp. ANC5681]MCL5769317.1 hypothetical protein [Acinetobacter sp. ANC5681]